MIDNSKEMLLASNLTLDQANELRIELMKNVDKIWVLVFNNNDVYIANNWGGIPTIEQQNQSKQIVEKLNLTCSLKETSVTIPCETQDNFEKTWV